LSSPKSSDSFSGLMLGSVEEPVVDTCRHGVLSFSLSVARANFDEGHHSLQELPGQSLQTPRTAGFKARVSTREKDG
jgi:hypothetical protein